MNARRKFLTGLLGSAAAVGVAATAAPPKKWGYLSVERHRKLKAQGIDLHVFSGGQDVTKHCFEADDIAGYARLYKHNQEGHKYVDPHTHTAAAETVYGIEIRQA